MKFRCCPNYSNRIKEDNLLSNKLDGSLPNCHQARKNEVTKG